MVDSGQTKVSGIRSGFRSKIRSKLGAKFNFKLPPLPKPPPTHQPSRSTLYQLAAIIALALLSHFNIANPAVAIFAVLIFVLKVGLIYRSQPAPPSWVMIILMVLSLGLILFFYGGWNGQKAGISFLVLLVSLKFLESRGLRDYFVTCLILYFLAASSFLFNSSISNIAIIVLYTVAITAILLKLSNPSEIKALPALGSATSIILKALPLAVFLFFFFPRIQGDFGFLPSQDFSDRKNALSNSLVAGEMAASAFDNSLAFRVQFDGAIPQRKFLYWRSKVMSVERNFQWEVTPPRERNLREALRKRQKADLNKGEINYEILHEKSKDFYIPYLDYVAGTSIGDLLGDYSVRLTAQINTDFNYRGSSNLYPSLPTPIKLDSTRLLQTQAQPSAKMQALLSQWRSTAQSDKQLADAVYQWLIDNEFSYSLTPPILDENQPLEDFLFNTKTGYCEHYASAFTTLMRWLSVPARVVVGYQGGTINPQGNYIEVNYSDAHAWSEIWIDGQWQRYDATAVVSPERIEYGMDAFIELWDSNLLGLGENISGRALSNILNPTGMAGALNFIKNNVSNFGYQWNKWIVNYDFDAQRKLLSKIGFSQRNTVGILIVILMLGGFAILLFYFWQLLPKPQSVGEAQKAYLKFVGRFRKMGIIKEPSDTPNDFAQKIIRGYPSLAPSVQKVTDDYVSLRYSANEGSIDLLKQFKQTVKQFKLTE